MTATSHSLSGTQMHGRAALRIAVSGGSGLIGRKLTDLLCSRGDQVLSVTRYPGRKADEIEWSTRDGFTNAARLEDLDAFVHLAGENIATGRWTHSKKARIRQSRVDGTRQVAQALTSLRRRPRVLVCASAIGFYGDRGDAPLTEADGSGQGFLAEVCESWERAADPARDAGIRVVHLRIGVVISRDGGALTKMLTPFRMGLGGLIGSGKQYWSWVAIDDVVGAICHSIQCVDLRGPVNCVAPDAVTNSEFTKTLGDVLHRPAFFPMPAFVARMVLGEMADELLLSSIRVVPAKLRDTGYNFRFADLNGALRHELQSVSE